MAISWNCCGFERIGALGAYLVLALSVVGCQWHLAPDGSYYEERIEPAIIASCARNVVGCHLANERGSAAGNLDVTSYDSLRRRTDLLLPYGPYPRPLLLLKASAQVPITVETLDGTVMIETDIRHAGGSVIAEGSSSFRLLSEWIDNGYTRTGAPAETSFDNDGECVHGAGNGPGFSAETEPADPTLFDRFVSDVQPTLVNECAGSGCHGAALADLHLSCGQDETEQRWNYWIAVRHLSSDPPRSELLRRPLASSRGGAYHGGGDTFATDEDAGYQAILGWAEQVAAEAPELVASLDASEGYRFFVNRVQPLLVREGCMALNCHSPLSIVFNLRGGSQGTFSRFARDRNYAMARSRLAIESPDPNQSRIIAKNLFTADQVPGGDGITHRGGALFEDLPGGSMRPTDCEMVDADAGDLNEIPSYCVLARWHEIERAAAIAEGWVDADADALRAVAWVARPPGIGGATDFDTYRPGADLRIADATFDAVGVTLGASRSALVECGLDPATADIRTPASSWDGRRLAFAVRSSATEPLRLWEIQLSGGCAPLTEFAAEQTEADGMLIHDFDPAYAPDGRIAFASTRGTSWGRPTRTPAQMESNSDIYIFDSTTGVTRQLSFLLNQEVAPGFMLDGRVIYTSEKRELDFHMLSLRRQNIDGGDYHPLYASRHTVGFSSATEVQQLIDRNFVFIAAPLGAPESAGSVAVFNRTIGPDQDDRDPEDREFRHSLTMPARGVHHGGTGLFRSPTQLPSGHVLVACAPDITDPDATAVDFDLCELDTRSSDLRVIGGDPGVAETDVVALFARLNRGVLISDGGGIDRPEILPDLDDAVVHFNDFPMIQSLMFANTRTGRPVDERLGGYAVLVNSPPPAGTTSFADVAADLVDDSFGRSFVRQERLGWVPLFGDGSARMRVPGGLALSFEMTDGSGTPLDLPEGFVLSGPDRQREHEQYYPGERIQRSIPRRFFNGVCGGCHGSLSGRELDIAVNLDVITGASVNAARDAAPIDLMGP